MSNNKKNSNGAAVAAEILKQIGGNQFLIITGCRAVDYDKQSLTLTLPQNNTNANRLKITLTAADLYIMEFNYVAMHQETFERSVKTIRKFDGVFFDKLQEVFTSVTGLITKL